MVIVMCCDISLSLPIASHNLESQVSTTMTKTAS